MENTKKTAITVETTVNAPLSKVWEFWNEPQHIINWYYASDDWHAPYAENDLKVGGYFKTTMAAKDGSASFDFEGTYDQVEAFRYVAFTIGDRQVEIYFTVQGNETKITETFEVEDIHSEELQRTGWQAIIDNFKRYTEAN